MTRCAAAMLLLSFASLGSAEDIQYTRIFGHEVPGEYKHPSSITQLASGDFYLVYYGGSGEYGTDTAVYGARRAKGSTEWTSPKIIADTPFRSEGNAVIWQAPDGRVWLFYVTRYGETWSTSRIKARYSDDGARSWSDPLLIAFEQGMMVRSHPIELANGDYLLPIYHETGSDREEVPDDSTSLFLRYDKETETWSETNRVRSRLGNIQPSVVAVDDDYLIAYCRRGGGYDGRDDGFTVRTESRDGGRTWSEGTDSEFPNPNAAVDFIKLTNGHLLLVYNDSKSQRTPLTVAISTDSDKTYPHKRNIAEGRNSYAYPVAIQAADGRIHVIYTSDGRTVINEAVFEEEAILDSAKQ